MPFLQVRGKQVRVSFSVRRPWSKPGLERLRQVVAGFEPGVRLDACADRARSATGAMRPYLQAKAEADRYLMASGLDYTILRPGMLTDDPGTGRVRLSTELGGRAPVPRDDVAAVLAEMVEAPNTIGVVAELFTGDTPVPEAVRALEPPGPR